MVGFMASTFRQHADEDILDRAAELFAQHGFAHTSLQDLAGAVGLSKAGLLHHFPSKDALYEAAQQSCREQVARVLARVADLPLGPERDRLALELLLDVALDRPGLVALAFRAVTAKDARAASLEQDDLQVFETFGVDPADMRAERLIRVIGALSALAVLSLAAHHLGEKAVWRRQILATCVDALGHGASTSDRMEL
jgi:AcrR family transcriptional regulator